MSGDVHDVPLERAAGIVRLLTEPHDGTRRERPLPADVFDEACAIFERAWQASPLALPRLRALAPRGGVATPRFRNVEALALAARAVAAQQNAHVVAIARAFAARAVPWVLLKGAASRFVAYADPTDRPGFDLDLGVPRARLADALDAVGEIGFVSAEFHDTAPFFRPADPVLRAEVERDHYELGFLVRRVAVSGLDGATEAAVRACMEGTRMSGKCWHLTPGGGIGCYVAIDMHHGITHEIPVDEIVAAARTVTYLGTPLPVPSPAWALFHAIFKLYWEGVHAYGVGAYQYGDVARLAARLGGQDVIELALLLERWRLEAAGYFVLRRLPELGCPLSPALAILVEEAGIPDRNRSATEQNDLGDMWPKLFGYR